MYITEAEQIEAIKKWWREYGVSVVVGILLAIVLGFGWRAWEQHHEQQLEHASMRYEQLVTNIVNGNNTAAEVQAQRLMARYPHTPYAELAALQLARQEVFQKNYPAAETHLTWVVRHGSTPALREVARLRAARVLLAQNQTADALKLLNKMDDSAYLPEVDEVRGDILVSQGKLAEAKDAYQDAIKAFPGLEILRPLLQMKLDNLAGA